MGRPKKEKPTIQAECMYIKQLLDIILTVLRFEKLSIAKHLRKMLKQKLISILLIKRLPIEPEKIQNPNLLHLRHGQIKRNRNTYSYSTRTTPHVWYITPRKWCRHLHNTKGYGTF